MVSNATQHRLSSPRYSLSVYTVYLVRELRVELEIMPLNISWSKFQEKIANALASSVIYAEYISTIQSLGCVL